MRFGELIFGRVYFFVWRRGGGLIIRILSAIIKVEVSVISLSLRLKADNTRPRP